MGLYLIYIVTSHVWEPLIVAESLNACTVAVRTTRHQRTSSFWVAASTVTRRQLRTNREPLTFAFCLWCIWRGTRPAPPTPTPSATTTTTTTTTTTSTPAAEPPGWVRHHIIYSLSCSARLHLFDQKYCENYEILLWFKTAVFYVNMC